MSRSHDQDPPQNVPAIPRASKKLGQNFLTDKRVIGRIINELQPQHGETIIEIGPGGGALTESLVASGSRVIAIEFDRNLIPVLAAKFAGSENFILVQQDALEVEFCDLIKPAAQARVVANLPYNVGTAIVQRLLEQRACLPDMVLMLQKEVVERMTAAPGSKERGYLSVVVETYANAEKLFDVAPGSFRPAPKIWSSVIRLTRRASDSGHSSNEEILWRLVSAGFAQRRKTILNNLRSAPSPLQEVLKAHGGASIVLCQAEVGVERRAETLTLEEWTRIAAILA